MTISRHASKRCLSTSSKHVPVLIVGGGPSGLLLSNLLSTYGTPSLLLEARNSDQLFRHPQAHFMNTRTMEILRHCLPDLYQKTRAAMPPVEEWRYFSFGYDAVRSMARVVHPVDQPLETMKDSNGVLLRPEEVQAAPTQIPAEPLSVCSVGHLAQHTFSKLLYESGMDLLFADAAIQLQSPVDKVEWIQEDSIYKVTTQSKEIIYSPIVVGADGSNSKIRNSWKIVSKGQEGIQNLVNVHVRASNVNLPPAMLYAIYNDDCVAMMVRHSKEEFVLQIPYFPPYQTMARHFSHNRVHTLMKKIMNTATLDILSVRPWAMSSQIASSYIDPLSHSGVLIGDAAHVFPPAGGFGMNTGLQDAHNLAWRLSDYYHQQDCSSKKEQLREHLLQYQNERQPVARNNAALSVRNFKRVLNLAKSCYLDDQHPALLTKILDNLPLMTLAMKQDMFQSLLKTALSPLAGLKQGTSWHAKLVQKNLRAILEQGGGLPLLFPKYELGFRYANSKTDDSSPHFQDDTLGYQPRVEGGYLMPHVLVDVVSDRAMYPNLQFLKENLISTSDLPSQMRTSRPVFVALVVGNNLEVKDMNGIQVARLVRDCSVREESENLVLLDKSGKFTRMFPSGIVLIRPDGHIACTCASFDDLLEKLLLQRF